MQSPGDWHGTADIIPMGLLYVAEACRRHGHDPVLVQLHDAAATISGMEARSRWGEDRWRHLLARVLDEMAPRAVGIQCHWSYHSAGAFAVAGWIKELDPSVHVTLGGVHAGALAEPILRSVPAVDSIVIGDGDAAYPALLAGLDADRVSSVPGVVRRDRDGVLVGDGTPAAPTPPDEVVTLSFDPDLVWPRGRGRYIGLPFMRGRCPKPCTFCSLNSERLFPALQKSLARQLDEQIPDMLARKVPLYLPEHFSGPRPLEALAAALEAHGDAAAVLVDVHPGMITDRAADALARISARTPRLRVWLGVEAGAERVRRRAGRDITDDALLAAFDRLAARGLTHLQSSLMVGLPGETPDTIAASDAMIAALNERGVMTNVLPVVAFPETAIFRDPGAYGVRLRMEAPRDFEALSLGWHAPIDAGAISVESDALPADARVEATLKLRLRQRERLAYRVTPELFRTMEHLPGLRVPGESERMVERYAELLESPRFGGPIRPARFWSPAS